MSTDYEEAVTGELQLHDLTAAEMLARVVSMFEEAPDAEGAFLDVSFTDSHGFLRTMRMFLLEDKDDSSTVH